MKRTFVASAAVVAVMAVTATQGYARDVALKPSSPWNVHWAGNSCLLARQFGTGDNRLTLSMRAYKPGYEFETTLAGPQVSLLTKPNAFRIAYGGGEPRPVWGQAGRIPKLGPSITFSGYLSMTAPEPTSATNSEALRRATERQTYPDTAFEAQLDRITLVTSFRKIVLQTGPMAKALTSLRTCTDGLVKSWGLDLAVQSALSRNVRNADPEWIQKIIQSYPATLSFQGKSARVSLRIMVDRTGKPTSCHALQAFSNTEFDVKACDIALKYARFDPALDAGGQPVDSYYTTSVIYRM